jgi:hypothetical protein
LEGRSSRRSREEKWMRGVKCAEERVEQLSEASEVDRGRMIRSVVSAGKS